MRAILLLNETTSIKQWERAALVKAIAKGLEITLVAHCTNTPPRRLSKSTIPYYALAFASLRSFSLDSPVDIEDLIGPDTPRIRFEGEFEGAWQRIPAETVEQFRGNDVLIRLGMSLIRGTEDLPLRYGVLSYHHGAPEEYRGRPAGFYELLEGRSTQGVIVQRLSDRLAGGSIVARGTSRVIPHSFRQTRQASLLAGIPLLGVAVSRLEAQDLGSPPQQLGPNYRFPTVRPVIRLVTVLAKKRLARGWYGLTREKSWKAAVVSDNLAPHGDSELMAKAEQTLPTPDGFSFVADPFWDGDGAILAELMGSRSGIGQIGRWSNGEWQKDFLASPGNHFSYPQFLVVDGHGFMFPETEAHSPPRLIPIEATGKPGHPLPPLQGLEQERIVDGTLCTDGSSWYLFGSRAPNVDTQLDLWTAPSAEGPYSLHPDSPVCIDVRGARMAGPITKLSDGLYRFGQDCSENYGGKTRVHKIQELTPEHYREEVTGTITVAGFWGPHTVSLGVDGCLIDYYDEQFSPLAGYRRLAAVLAKRVQTVRRKLSPGRA